MGPSRSSLPDHPQRSLRRFIFRLFLTLGIYLFLFLLVELGARIATGNWTDSFLERNMALMKQVGDPAVHDPVLGWVPAPGFSTNSDYWHQQVTITLDGLRSNGVQTVKLTGRPILAVGDSFTYGMEVADHQTWPAHLERLLERPVLNGGVFGYGIDQMVLRARQLLPRVNPEWLVLTFIPDDIRRCELRIRGAQKPFFRFVDGALRLENQPVPLPGRQSLGWFRRVFGYSWVINTVKRKVDPYWVLNQNRPLQAHQDGNAVASALLCQLADELAARGTKFLVVALAEELQQADERTRAEAVINVLLQHHVPVLNLLGPLAAMKEQDLPRFQSYFQNHMTDLGNRYVAEQIARSVRDAEVPR